MPQIVDTQMWQSCFPSQSMPNFVNRRVALLPLAIDEQVIEFSLGIQQIQDIDGAIVQRYRANAF